MTDRDDLLRRVRRANPAPCSRPLPASLTDARPPLDWLVEAGTAGTFYRPAGSARPTRRGPALAALALAVTLVVTVPLLLLGGGEEGGPMATTMPSTTLPPATLATTTPTTTTTLPGPAIVRVAVLPDDDSVLSSQMLPLVALSAGEVWAAFGEVEATLGALGGLIAHLEDGVWEYWRLTPAQAGVPGEMQPELARGLAVAPDGVVWAATDIGVFSFDGVEWALRFDGPAGGVAVDESGTVWIGGSWGAYPPVPWLARWDGERWERLDGSPEEMPGGIRTTPLAVPRGGDAWIAVSPGFDWSDLMRHDCATLEVVQVGDLETSGGMGAVGISSLETAPNGDLWVGGFLGDDWERVVLARFDGETWTLYDWPFADTSGVGVLPFDMAVGPDGVVWFAFEGGLGSFDGTEWVTRLDSAGESIFKVDIAPDGTVWYSDPTGIHVFNPYLTAPDG
jgi:hypothetical protein